jgi:hypothetical protein
VIPQKLQQRKCHNKNIFIIFCFLVASPTSLSIPFHVFSPLSSFTLSYVSYFCLIVILLLFPFVLLFFFPIDLFILSFIFFPLPSPSPPPDLHLYFSLPLPLFLLFPLSWITPLSTFWGGWSGDAMRCGVVHVHCWHYSLRPLVGMTWFINWQWA